MASPGAAAPSGSALLSLVQSAGQTAATGPCLDRGDQEKRCSGSDGAAEAGSGCQCRGQTLYAVDFRQPSGCVLWATAWQTSSADGTALAFRPAAGDGVALHRF